eukprot:TRINITY_DN10935_c0_g1_i1.p1 TRINITY_DN10935_c0_g1~~TRINITY_DN10935_c0_g1_i1.p1  ORF type:complete len:540 (+),score=119.70 TRINITY_DN10935_c0_g1_i1:84-1703(+)
MLWPARWYICLLGVGCCAASGGDKCKTTAMLQVTHDMRGSGSAQAKHADSPSGVEVCTIQNNTCVDMKLWPHPKGASTALLDASSRVYSSQEVQAVIIRHGEDLRWLDALTNIPAIVYNKGGRSDLLPKARSNLEILETANQGREDETMLRHIISKYDELAGVTVFLQGWPFPHCTGLVETLQHVLASLSSPDSTQGPVPISGEFWKYSLEHGRLGLLRDIAKSHSKERGGDVSQQVKEEYSKTCQAILGKACPSTHWVAEGSQWAVRREHLRRHPKELYEKALALGEGYEHKLRGLVLEAIWPVLWGFEDWQPKMSLNVLQVYGKYSKVLEHQQAVDHCTSAHMLKPLLSCEEHMSACEFQRALGLEVESNDFEQRRQKFEIADAEGQWSMTVRLHPFLEGAATWEPNQRGAKARRPEIIVDSSGLLLLQPVDALVDGGITWTISKTTSSEGEHAFAISTQTEQGLRYLGCDGGAALVLDLPVVWHIVKLNDLNLLYTDVGQHVLSLSRSGKEFQCRPRHEKDPDIKHIFLIELLRRQ